MFPLAKKQSNNEVQVDLKFPPYGIDETRGYARQRPGTTVDCQNVRGFEPVTGRERGGSRPGLIKYMPSLVNGTNPIQDLNYLVSSTVVPAALTSAFSYGMAVNTGFGIGNGGNGASLFSGIGAVSGYALGCSTWDSSGNLYVAEVNVTTGLANLYSVVGSTGAVLWGPITVPSISGSLRVVTGMVATDRYLYVIVQKGGGTASVTRYFKDTGAVDAILVTLPATQAISTGSHNNLAAIGNILGIEIAGSGAGKAGFLILNGLTGAASTFTAWTGTNATANPSKVVSDGQSNFYTVVSTTTAQVVKIGLGGVTVWTSTAADQVNGLCYDTSTNQLVALCNSIPGVRSLNLATGAVLSVVNSGAQVWNEIDSDNQGHFTLWKNSVASNDVMGISPTLGAVWGPSSLANAVHSGASSNKSVQIAAPVLGSRLIRGLVTAGGSVYTFNTSAATLVVGGAALSSSAQVVFSAQNGFNMFYVDGVSYKYYNASQNKMLAWTGANGGTIPVDAGGGCARLICLWRGRTVIAGFTQNPQQLFMSAVNDPFNWNFSPPTPSGTQAFATTVTSLTGIPGDAITCIIPYKDDTLIIGCDHSIYQLTGDPLAGGQFDLISDTIGITWGRPWCKDPVGQIYFFTNKAGVQKMTPGGLPVPMSQQIRRKLDNIDLSTNLIRMAWDLQARGLWLFVTPIGTNTVTMSFFYDELLNAWYKDVLPPAMNPLAVCVFDGDSPSDRVTLLGGKDGYIRATSNTATTDDNTTINSYVWIGPIGSKMFDAVMLTELQATLDTLSGTVTFSIYTGSSAEAAFQSAPVMSGTWVKGRNPVSIIRRADIAVYLKISATTWWAMEYIRGKYEYLGRIRQQMYTGA